MKAFCSVPGAIASAYPARYGGLKALARDAGISIRAALNLRSGDSEAGYTKLLALMARSEQLEKHVIEAVRAERARVRGTENVGMDTSAHRVGGGSRAR